MNSFGLFSDYGSSNAIYWWQGVPLLIKCAVVPLIVFVYTFSCVAIIIAGSITIIPELMLWMVERQGRPTK